jgi:hypothetical protein
VLLRRTFPRRLVAACAIVAFLAACDEGPHKPSESYTYNVHLYYGKDVAEHKALGQVVGISQCKTRAHAEAGRMQLKGNTYKYACCWVNEGKACYETHK